MTHERFDAIMAVVFITLLSSVASGAFGWYAAGRWFHGTVVPTQQSPESASKCEIQLQANQLQLRALEIEAKQQRELIDMRIRESCP